MIDFKDEFGKSIAELLDKTVLCSILAKECNWHVFMGREIETFNDMSQDYPAYVVYNGETITTGKWSERKIV